ncbi:MAG: hypothetical protein GY794_10995 [bacterium]|nr:hypothetical protein [bacterium]
MAKKQTENDICPLLLEELKQFKVEKEKIRAVVGQIGGKASKRTERTINIVFVSAVLGLFVFDIIRHVYHVATDVLPPMLALSLGVFLVSIKIVWMIHRQSKVDHFQFWILNSIEYRLNDMSARVRNITKALEAEPDSDD